MLFCFCKIFYDGDVFSVCGKLGNRDKWVSAAISARFVQLQHGDIDKRESAAISARFVQL